jgi:K+-transporting ATPase ATPase A chain
MNLFDWLQVILFFTALIGLAKPLGAHMARVYGGEKTFLHRVLEPVEMILYRAAGVNPKAI